MHKKISSIFESPRRPDMIVIQKGSRFSVLELTCCFELSSSTSRHHNTKRYQELRQQFLCECSELMLIYLEVTNLGFLTRNSADFVSFLEKLNINSDRCVYKCMEVALRASYYIFCRRNKTWRILTIYIIISKWYKLL